MYRQCTTEKSTLQQRKFEDAMLEALSVYSYDEITISELCRVAGLSRKTFYRLFETKMDIMYALVDHKLMDLHAHVSSFIPGGMRHFLSFWKDQSIVLEALKKCLCTSILIERTAQFILQENQALAHCLGADEDNGSEILLFNMTAIYSLVLHWHSTGYQKPIDEMSALMTSLITTPMVKIPGAITPYIS